MERKDVIKMGTVIKIKCIDQALTLINSPVIASGGLNENKLECEFCEKWDGFSKTAVFYQDKKNVYYSVLDENDTCIIPKEATASKGTMCFGIFGSKGDVTRTSEILRYKIDEGAITEDLKPSDPTPDIYEQLLAELQAIRDLSAETLSNEQAFEKAITEQQTTFETNITKKESDFEASITGQQSTFETAQTKRQEDYETNLNGQMTTFRSETEAEITEKLSKVYRPCGSVANYDALPKNAEVGDVYNLLDTGVNYAWTGTEWDSLAGIIDLSNFYNKTEVDTKLNTEITNRTNADSTLQSNIDKKVNTADIVDNLTSSDTDKPLSAKQGKTLNESKQSKTIIYSNIVVDVTPTALTYYCTWDTQQKYGYKATVEIVGLTVNSLIQNIIMTDTLLESVACIVTTEANSLTFYTESADALSGNIYTLAISEVN